MTISIFVLKFKSYPNFLNVSNKHNSSESIIRSEKLNYVEPRSLNDSCSRVTIFQFEGAGVNSKQYQSDCCPKPKPQQLNSCQFAIFIEAIPAEEP